MAERNIREEMEVAIIENGRDIYCYFYGHLGAWYRHQPDAPALNKASETLKHQARNQFSHHYPEANQPASFHDMCIYSLLRTYDEDRKRDVHVLREDTSNWNNNRKDEITALQVQNKNQADNIATLTNSLNEKAIAITSLTEQITQQAQAFKALKDILCSHIDCNVEVMGAVEPGAND